MAFQNYYVRPERSVRGTYFDEWDEQQAALWNAFQKAYDDIKGGSGGADVSARLDFAGGPHEIVDTDLWLVEFDAEEYDTSDFWDVGTPEEIVIPTTGKYRIDVTVLIGRDASAGLDCSLIVKNNTTKVNVAEARDVRDYNGSLGRCWATPHVSQEAQFTAGDVVVVIVANNSGFNKDVASAAFSIRKVA